MTDSTSNKTWGAFAPVMPSFIRLVAGVIVLVIVEAVVLGFPGISNPITGSSTISVANIVVFMLGLIVCFILLKFGTQLADTVSDTYKNYRTWTPLLAYFFQIVAIGILYSGTMDSRASSAPSSQIECDPNNCQSTDSASDYPG